LLEIDLAGAVLFSVAVSYGNKTNANPISNNGTETRQEPPDLNLNF